MIKVAVSQTEDEELIPVEEKTEVPPFGTREHIHYWSELEGNLPSPIDVSITVILGAKWRTERPYLEGGPFLEKHVFSQAHFHWGANMMEGSEHTVDRQQHPGEMQAIFFRAEYITQEEAMRHPDGVVVICNIIKYGVNPDERLEWIIEGFPRIREAQTHTRIGPLPLSRLLPMFYEDYFLYWGSLTNVKGESCVVRWLVPRITLFASFEQMKEFRKLWDPWDEPIIRNFRPLQEKHDRHVFFIRPHWNQYRSLLPIPKLPEPSITIVSPEYRAKPWMFPPQNAYMLPEPEQENDDSQRK
ncbi:carbonic anhydrase 3-like [Pararge aegeria]|uniref:carbonic anhydrase 3-like n=1 Tax=Pararge aegeria TaxID=116150 RepID=UPI0019D1884D|nr:carbonic anhydrase 3-like [Pararge aegeria]